MTCSRRSDQMTQEDAYGCMEQVDPGTQKTCLRQSRAELEGFRVQEGAAKPGRSSGQLGACGAAAQYALNQGFWGCLLCSAAVLAVIDAGRILLRLFTGAASLPALLEVAVPEILWSLCFVAVIYPWFRWVRGRIVRLLRL